MINICVPVLRRYDLLRGMLASAQYGADHFWIIDNGMQPQKIHDAVFGIDRPFNVYHPPHPMGIAESWNWFIRNVDEERIITNDDVIFSLQSIPIIASTPGDIVFACGYSCFLIRNSCTHSVGLFDETISPGYGYFEDCDYSFRIDAMVKDGYRVVMADARNAGVKHIGSQTWQSGTPEEIDEHWRKFNIAKANFLKKWGRLPE